MMTNRMLIYLTALVLGAMALLFVFNLSNILKGRTPDQPYLKYSNVRGMAVAYNSLLYTLNFQQQKEVINLLNESVRVLGIKPGKRQKPDFAQIIVYQFDDHPDIVIQPIAYVDQNLVFSSPAWNDGGLLMELSEGQLQSLLSQTYDH